MNGRKRLIGALAQRCNCVREKLMWCVLKRDSGENLAGRQTLLVALLLTRVSLAAGKQ